MNDALQHSVVQCDGDICSDFKWDLIGEEPLSIEVEGNPYAVVMRTPGEEVFHAAGFCLAEGIVDRPEDLAVVGHCQDMDPNVITITLQPDRKRKVASLLDRRGFVSQTSCGICGKEFIEDLQQIISPLRSKIEIRASQALHCIDQLRGHQTLYEKTRAAHAAILFDSNLNVLSFAEDVGRHNALDKAIGKAFMAKQLGQARLAALSSRISYELVQKAGRAQLPLLISVSRPTALAVDLAKSLNMTLACLGPDDSLLVFCGQERIKRAK